MSDRAVGRGRVLVVEDEAYVRDSLVEILRSRRYDASAAGSVADALAHLGRAPVDVVLTDLRMPGADGLELVRRMRTAAPDVPVIILTGHGTVTSAVECLKAGASDYILKPVDADALEVALDRALEARALRREVRYLRSAAAAPAEGVVGESAPWRRVLGMVEAAAPTDSVVLFTGESGAGKELLARRLHAVSTRASGPFVKVNCASVPLEMWESEFFGHRKGSFTGAATDREGRFQLADRGTLLLDEVGAMPFAGPGQAAARDPGRRVREARRRAGDARRRARRRVDEQRPRGRGAAGEVPRGPLLPPQRGPDRRAPAAGPSRRHPPPRVPLRRADRHALGRPTPSLPTRDAAPGSSSTHGPATSASCAT